MKMQTLQGAARRARRPTSAGYTAVEVLMSLAILAVGVVGIIASEKVTLVSNQHAKNLAIATRIAQSWIGMLNAEASLWDSGGLNSTRNPWLSQGSTNSGWFRPDAVGPLDFGPAFDALGNSTDVANARFCVDLRMAPLTGVSSGAGMVRAEVRVMWLRDQPSVTAGDAALVTACSLTPLAASADDATRLMQFVFMSSAVRQVGG